MNIHCTQRAFGIILAPVTSVEISLLESRRSRFWVWRDLLIEELNLFTVQPLMLLLISLLRQQLFKES